MFCNGTLVSCSKDLNGHKRLELCEVGMDTVDTNTAAIKEVIVELLEDSLEGGVMATL